MLLTRKIRFHPRRRSAPRRTLGARIATMDRRAFLKRSGLVAGAGAFASQLPYGTMGKAQAADESANGKARSASHRLHALLGRLRGRRRRRERRVDAAGAGVRFAAEPRRALREGRVDPRARSRRAPAEVADEARQRQVPEDQLGAGDQRGRRQARWRSARNRGPDAVFWVGSSKHSNEQSYLLRKFVSYFGSNNCDHQARICHSTTVAGVANTWGYGAMTNSYNDMQNTKCALYIGSNAAEAHPVSMLHMLHAKETGAKMIVVDPRFTRTAAKADYYVRIRSGTDIAFLFGVLYHIFKNNWQDDKYIHDRVYGMDKVKADVMAKWTPDKVRGSDCGVPEAAVYKVAEMMAKNRPSTLVWCMGQTQHSIGNAFVRASCILQLALGNIGVSGGGANIFRGHDNVQGATDIGPNPDSLPGYYGVADRLVEALRRGVGRRLRVDQEAVRVAGDDGKARHDGVALDRRRAGEERADRPGQQPARTRLLGPCAEQPDARQGNGRGDEKARRPRRHRSVSVGDRGDGGDGAQGRRLSAARGTQLETSGQRARRRTARCSGASA